MRSRRRNAHTPYRRCGTGRVHVHEDATTGLAFRCPNRPNFEYFEPGKQWSGAASCFATISKRTRNSTFCRYGRMLGVRTGFGLRISFDDEDDVTLAPEILVKEPERKPRAERPPGVDFSMSCCSMRWGSGIFSVSGVRASESNTPGSRALPLSVSRPDAGAFARSGSTASSAAMRSPVAASRRSTGFSSDDNEDLHVGASHCVLHSWFTEWPCWLRMMRSQEAECRLTVSRRQFLVVLSAMKPKAPTPNSTPWEFLP